MSEQWEIPEWYKDEKVRHLWIYKNVTEDGAVLSALVKDVGRIHEILREHAESIEDCTAKETVNQAETNRKLDVVIEFLKPFTSIHDGQIQQRQVLTAVTPQGTAIQQTTTIATKAQNPIQWAVENPWKAFISLGLSIPTIVVIWKALVWVVQTAATYGK